ncbi:cutA, putative [Plasmodium ovale]|uniref:CutA, putative n=1 Tax=Plasmodium ovale TaxID=36330 RepID=A0A1D3UAY0_PLAOA|nr:cutA, putative [Plasmodium ovale]
MHMRALLIMLLPVLIAAKKRWSKFIFHSLFVNTIFKNNAPERISICGKYSNLCKRYSSNDMDYTPPFIAVYVTAPTRDVAEKISNVLLKEKLASCINIIPGVLSMYHWKGEINKDNEVLMMIKTKKNLFSQIVSCVKLNHPYEVPEVIAVPIQYGSKDYLDWVSNSVKSDEDEQMK